MSRSCNLQSIIRPSHGTPIYIVLSTTGLGSSICLPVRIFPSPTPLIIGMYKIMILWWRYFRVRYFTALLNFIFCSTQNRPLHT